MDSLLFFLFFCHLGVKVDCDVWDHPLKTLGNFHDFWTLLTPLRRQIWRILDPCPLKNADVLNGWPLSEKSLVIHFEMPSSYRCRINFRCKEKSTLKIIFFHLLLKYGFCKKLLQYKWNEVNLWPVEYFFHHFFPD